MALLERERLSKRPSWPSGSATEWYPEAGRSSWLVTVSSGTFAVSASSRSIHPSVTRSLWRVSGLRPRTGTSDTTCGRGSSNRPSFTHASCSRSGQPPRRRSTSKGAGFIRCLWEISQRHLIKPAPFEVERRRGGCPLLEQLACVNDGLFEDPRPHVVSDVPVLGRRPDTLHKLLVTEGWMERDEADTAKVPELTVTSHEDLPASGYHSVADPDGQLGRFESLSRSRRAIQDQVERLL